MSSPINNNSYKTQYVGAEPVIQRSARVKSGLNVIAAAAARPGSTVAKANSSAVSSFVKTSSQINQSANLPKLSSASAQKQLTPQQAAAVAAQAQGRQNIAALARSATASRTYDSVPPLTTNNRVTLVPLPDDDDDNVAQTPTAAQPNTPVARSQKLTDPFMDRRVDLDELNKEIEAQSATKRALPPTSDDIIAARRQQQLNDINESRNVLRSIRNPINYEQLPPTSAATTHNVTTRPLPPDPNAPAVRTQVLAQRALTRSDFSQNQ